MKFRNLEKLVRVTAWIKRFAMKLKKSTEAYGRTNRKIFAKS